MGWLFCFLKVFIDMICTGCKIDKPETEFYLYKECGKIKPRRRCKECLKSAAIKRSRLKKPERIITPIVPKPSKIDFKVPNFEPKVKVVPTPQKEKKVPKIEDNEVSENGKLCIKCNIRKTDKQFYANRNVCRRCILTAEKVNRSEKRQQILEEQGGSFRIPTKPGVYSDELQQRNTYEFLTLLGWTYNEESNMFYKLPIKDSEGNWFHKNGEPFNKAAKKVYLEYYNTITADKLPKFDRIYHNSSMDIDNLNDMIYEFFIDKVDRKTLQLKYNLSENRINYYIRTIYHKIHEETTKNK